MDVDVDPPTAAEPKGKTKEDVKGDKKRFEVKKVRYLGLMFESTAYPDISAPATATIVECSCSLGVGCVLTLSCADWRC